MHVVHVVHDFLPRHRAGSEIYVHELARAQSTRHHVTVLCAEYDPARPHGHVEWRVHDGVPVVEIVNNWVVGTFEETYRSPLIGARLEHLIDVLRPDVLHVHNLLNLSFDVPAMARARGIPVVATLHDYTLVCASGGQRIHRRDAYVCHQIDAQRCARCFTESPFHSQISFAALTAGRALPGPVLRLARAVARRVPAVGRATGRAVAEARGGVTPDDIERRVSAGLAALAAIDLVVAPSASIAREYEALGVAKDRLVVADYGFRPWPRRPARVPGGALRIGFVGTLVWHKGPHVLLEALSTLDPARYEALLFGDTETFPDYVAHLRDLAGSRPVRFCGAFTGSEAPAVYGELDVLVVPSLWLENSPLVIHEAFMAGVPVVGAHSGGIADLIVDEVNGLLVAPGDAASLSVALQRLIADPALRQRLAAGIPPVRSLDVDAAEWETRYGALLSGYPVEEPV